ncbi:MAG TPA: hypothetical protein VK066_09060 [Chloroflexota bacterium]|nr:hypothetical protein [Chloroflexota bacterium]
MAAITVRDETFPGGAAERTLELLTERVTVRELIRARVYQAVTEHNAARALAPAARQTVEPSAVERLLNGTTARAPRRLDWEHEFERALAAFQRNGFLLFVDGQQYADLDAEIDLRADSHVTFLRLVPLAGG